MKTLGTIHSKDTLMLRVYCGTAKSADEGYDLTTSTSGNPIVQSKSTGKFFSLGWQEIIGLAIEAGINNPEEPKEAA
jgi:hypothetical protein